MNTLAEMLRIYDEQGLGTPTYTNSYSNGVSANGAVPIHDDNRSSARMAWAMAHSGQDQNGGQGRMPDYFNAGGQPNGGSYSPGAYREPQQFQPQRMQPQQQQGYSMTMGGVPDTHTVQNYLAQLLAKGPR